MKAHMHAADLDGRHVFWRHWPRPGGRPTLALHCSLSHAAEWTGLATARPEMSVAAPDLAGHGNMPDWEDASDLHGDSTAIARALARRIGLGGPVDVVGHSFGGTVALRLALESPELIRRLVLVEPVIFAAARGNTAVWPAFEAGHRALERLHELGDPAATLAAFLKVWGAGDPIGELLPKLQAYMTDRMRVVMALDHVLMDDSPGLLAPGRPEALDRPVLLVEGQDSPAVVGAIHAALASRLPQARRAVIAGARHMLPVTHAPQLAEVVGAFLS
jgi:pimeloyl-ACP methyl ester carboxylesterase